MGPENFAIKDGEKYLKRDKMPLLPEIHNTLALCISPINKELKTFKETTFPKKLS